LRRHLRVTHLALELRPRHQRRHGVDHDDVDRSRPDQGLRNLQRLLAEVGLRDQEVLDTDAQLPGVLRIERVLGVDERRQAAGGLCVGDDVQCERCLSGRLRAVDLDHPAAGHPSDSERGVERDRAAGNHVHPDLRPFTQPHHGTLPELPLDLTQGGLKCPELLLLHGHESLLLREPQRGGTGSS